MNNLKCFTAYEIKREIKETLIKNKDGNFSTYKNVLSFDIPTIIRLKTEIIQRQSK